MSQEYFIESPILEYFMLDSGSEISDNKDNVQIMNQTQFFQLINVFFMWLNILENNITFCFVYICKQLNFSNFLTNPFLLWQTNNFFHKLIMIRVIVMMLMLLKYLWIWTLWILLSQVFALGYCSHCFVICILKQLEIVISKIVLKS